ncbi:MAG: thioredoxin family protein, partial [Clostridia bacterium]|nr:thioredoxin family protein [Clostridia bacterium]
LPVSFTEDIFAALDIQDELQTLYTSGTVFHAFLGEKLPSWESAAKLVKTIAENYRLPYYTMSPTYSVCPKHGYLSGEHFTCPQCGSSAEVYSRITGYYRPVQNWNDGKSQEYKERKEYDVANHSTWPGITKTAKAEALPMLFTTSTCPNCAAAKDMLNAAGIKYTVVMAEENRDLARKYKIMQAPTLVVDSNGKVEKFAGLSALTVFVENNKQVG